MHFNSDTFPDVFSSVRASGGVIRTGNRAAIFARILHAFFTPPNQQPRQGLGLRYSPLSEECDD